MRLQFWDEKRRALACVGGKERVHSFGPKILRHHHFEEKVRDGIKTFVNLTEYWSRQ